MNGFVTTNRFARVLNLPISFPQTDLGSGRAIIVCKIPLAINQRLEIRSLSISLVAILTPGIIPIYLNTAMQLCSVGVYESTMISSPLVYAAFFDQTSTSNPFSCCVIETPGIYNVIVSNNTSNTDMAVSATGSAKIYY